MKDFTLKTKIYLYGTWLGGAVLIIWNLFHLQANNQLMLAALSVLGSLALILKVAGSTDRSHYSINFLIYAFAAVLLGIPAAVLVIVVSNVVEWIYHKPNWYIQAFNIACYVIAIQATGLVIGWINPAGGLTSLAGVIAIVSGMVIFTLLNHWMVGMILWLARGENIKESGMFEVLPIMIDLTLLILGGSLVLVWQFNHYAIILFLIPLYLIYSTLKVPMLERKADTDAKTGLFNHNHFMKCFENELIRANRADHSLTIIMADLDLLRNINNTYGHLAGDEVLIGIAKILKKFVREYDVVARFGGEEFSILMPETNVEIAYERAEMIRQIIEKAEFSVPTSMTPIKVTMSFGIAGRENFTQTTKEIVHGADTALYHSKLEGRNRTFVYFDGYFETFSAANQEQTPSSVTMPAQTLVIPVETHLSASLRYETAAPTNGPTSVEVETKSAAVSRPMPDISRPVKKNFSVNAFVGLLLLTAGALFAFVYNTPPQLDWYGLIAFTLLVIVTEWFSIDIYIRDTFVSTSAAPILAGTLLFGPLGALVLSLVYALTATLKFRSPFKRLVFNFSNQLLATMLYTIPLILWKINFIEAHPIIKGVVCFVAILLVYISTTSLVAMVMHLDLKVPFRQIWKEKFSWLALYYISLGVVAFTLCYGYLTAGLVIVAVILIPLLLIRWSQKQYIDRTREMVCELREKNQQLEKSSEEISQMNEGLLDTLAQLIDLRDPYVLGHSRQVTRYAVIIAKNMGLNKKQTELIHKASLLHDVGKLGIPEAILMKPTRLTASEFNIMKSHPIVGANILKENPSLASLIPIVKHHHEFYNGKGYPSGLAGIDIPIEARIVAVADAIEAMASDRPYRKALTQEQIRTELVCNSGTQFDPQVVELALKLFEPEEQSVVINVGHLNIGNTVLQFPVPNMVGD